MALIDLQTITKQYDTKVILNSINFTLQANQRIAIIGQNGQGKSTLMKIITRETQPDSGLISIDKSLHIEMLKQQPTFSEHSTVKMAIEEELHELKQARQEYEDISIAIATDYNNKALLKRQGELSNYLDFHHAWDLTNKIDRVLKEFKLKEYQDKPVHLLSGGEQRRVSLAALLLKKPDVLLLDEPTNHLDVYMVEFLEQLLLKEDFTLLFISHDRYFIDTVATSIVEIDKGELKSFQGGYSHYLDQKQKLLETMQKDHENLLRLVKAEAHWMQRGVTARRKRNQRRKEEYLELKQQAKSNPAAMNKIKLQLQREQQAFNTQDNKVMNRKKMLFELNNVCKSLGEKSLINNFSTRIVQKDRIAIVGPNGSGKSTLLKILMGELNIDQGELKKGAFNIGYFDQHRHMIHNDKTIMETFCPNGGDRVVLQDGRTMHVYGYLKNFLFPKEYLDKKVGVLSGGEKNRIALALLFTQSIDCLILDEPTNDLDIPTINILEEYLINFQGALILVSHDRYFIDKIAQKLYIFEGNGLIQESHQSYSDYLQDEKLLIQLSSTQETQPPTKNHAKENLNNQKKKFSYKEQREYDQLTHEIEELENAIEQLNHQLEDPSIYQTIGITQLSDQLQAQQESYEQKVERFLELELLQESFKDTSKT